MTTTEFRQLQEKSMEYMRLKYLYRTPMEVARATANYTSNLRQILAVSGRTSQKLTITLGHLERIAAEYAAMPEFAAELVEVASFNAMVASIR
jgi:hypothetical protein